MRMRYRLTLPVCPDNAEFTMRRDEAWARHGTREQTPVSSVAQLALPVSDVLWYA